MSVGGGVRGFYQNPNHLLHPCQATRLFPCLLDDDNSDNSDDSDDNEDNDDSDDNDGTNQPTNHLLDVLVVLDAREFAWKRRSERRERRTGSLLKRRNHSLVAEKSTPVLIFLSVPSVPPPHNTNSSIMARKSKKAPLFLSKRMPFQTTASPVESNEEEEQDESPTGLVPMPPATIVRNVSRDEGSVVSELTGLSAEPSYYASAASSPARGGYRPTHAATHNHAGDNSPPVVPAATATSLLSSQYQQQSSTYGLLQASTSFDTGFDTALQPLPEEPSVQFSGTGSSTQVRVNHHNGEKQQQQGNGEEGQEIAVVAASTSPADDNDDDNDARCSIDFLLDDPSGMTLARRLALRLMPHQWYYKPRVLDGVSEALGASMIPYRSSSLGPSAAPLTAAASEAYPFSHSRRESPSLAKAWAYFEHVALPRHVLEPKDASIPKKNCLVRIIRKLFCKAGKELRRAEPGERELPTKLYEPLFTPHKQLGDFGLGIGLYFSTLRAMTVRGGARACVLFCFC